MNRPRTKRKLIRLIETCERLGMTAEVVQFREALAVHEFGALVPWRRRSLRTATARLRKTMLAHRAQSDGIGARRMLVWWKSGENIDSTLTVVIRTHHAVMSQLRRSNP